MRQHGWGKQSAHDFNNMLSVMIGHAESQLELVTDPASPLSTSLREILDAANRSAELTRQLLAFARKQVAEPRVLELNEAVAGMTSILRRLVGAGVELVWKPCAEAWSVKMDPVQVHQVLANLVVNAKDSMGGSGTITIATDAVVLDEAFCRGHDGLAPGEHAALTVTDTGTGITPEVAARIFDPFFTTKEVGRGTGLGLAIVYGIVRQNRGLITVDTTPGHGTTFHIWLPRSVETSAVTEKSVREVVPVGRERILIVEDERALLELARGMLTRLGYEVLAAHDATSALAVFREHAQAIDLVISDVVLPGVGGYALMAELERIAPGLRHIFISGYAPEGTPSARLHGGRARLLPKPFSQAQLGGAVRQAIDAPGNAEKRRTGDR